MKRIANVGFGLALSFGLLASVAAAQDKPQSNAATQSDSPLGDLARQVRKDGAPVKAKPRVFDNDNIPREDKLSVVGTARTTDAAAALAPAAAPAAAADGKPADPNAAPSASKTPDEDLAQREAANKQWAEKITSQKGTIDLNQRELDVLQREYQIRAAAMYADAGNRIRNSTDWDKQDAQYKQQIADKEKAVEEAKQKMEDLQEQARKAGVPSSAREPE